MPIDKLTTDDLLEGARENTQLTKLNELVETANGLVAGTEQDKLVLAGDGTGTTMLATVTAVSLAASPQGVNGAASGTTDCTAADRFPTGVVGTAVCTRGSGANNCTNTGVYGEAYDGTTNVGVYGYTNPSAVNFGVVADGGLKVINGVSLFGDGAYNANKVIVAAQTSAGGTSHKETIATSANGTLDATAAPLYAAGVSSWSSCTRSAGANDVTNYGLYVGADGGQVNYAIYTDGGDLRLGGAADKVGFYGTAPIAKQTGVAVNLAAIHAALVALGLIGV